VGSGEQRLIWVDIVGRAVHQYDPASGTDTFVELDDMPGVALPRAGGGLVVAIGRSFAVLEPDGRLERIVEVPKGPRPSRMNDGNCDAAGRLWAGTITIKDEPDAGALYRLDPDLTVSVVIDSVSESNGIDWSPDDRLMYYVDSRTRRVDMFDFDANSGTIANQRPFVTFDEDDVLPDGLTVDTDGFVWVACWNGGAVRRFGPDGTLDLVVGFPTRQITSCAFGGDGLTDLYVTSAREGLTPEQVRQEPEAGAVFVCSPGATGRPQRPFHG
jgi:sugar lactone lactonase YvrE